MGWLGFLDKKEIVNEEVRAYGGSNLLTAIYGTYECNEEEVLKLPVVQSALEISGGTIAQLPIYLYKDNGDGSVDKKEDDYRCALLNESPNPLLSAYNMKKHMVKDYLLYGASRVYKESVRNKITGLYPLPAKGLQIEVLVRDAIMFNSYNVMVNNEYGSFNCSSDDLITILRDSNDGITSKGALHYGDSVFTVATRENEYMESIYSSGAMPLGVLTTTQRLTQPVLERLKASWQNLYGGVRNAGKTVILEEGMEYKPLSFNPKDMSSDLNNKANISDICRLFNIPESLVNSNANKYGSLEQNNIAFLQYTLSPIITAIENSLNQSLLLEEEKEEGYFFAFDTGEVLKTTEKDRYEAIRVGLDSGVITMNEARYKLNLKGIKDDVMKWSLGSVLFYPETGEMRIPNMGISLDSEGKQILNNNITEETEVKEEINKNQVEEKKVKEIKAKEVGKPIMNKQTSEQIQKKKDKGIYT